MKKAGRPQYRESGPVDFSRNVVNTITITEATFNGEECGTLTSDGLFTVTSLDCLYEWAERVSYGEYNLGCYITSDIDFENDTRTWPQIGTNEHPFTGRIIGNGKTISNFKSTGDARFTGFVAVMERVAPWRISRSIRLPLLPLIKEIWVMWTMMVIWVPSSVD